MAAAYREGWNSVLISRQETLGASDSQDRPAIRARRPTIASTHPLRTVLQEGYQRGASQAAARGLPRPPPLPNVSPGNLQTVARALRDYRSARRVDRPNAGVPGSQGPPGSSRSPHSRPPPPPARPVAGPGVAAGAPTGAPPPPPPGQEPVGAIRPIAYNTAQIRMPDGSWKTIHQDRRNSSSSEGSSIR